MAAATLYSLHFDFLEPLMSADILDRLQGILLAKDPKWASAFGAASAQAPSARRVNLAVKGSLRGALADEAAAGAPVQASLRKTIGGRRLPGRSVQVGFRGLGQKLHVNISASTRLFLGRGF